MALISGRRQQYGRYSAVESAWGTTPATPAWAGLPVEYKGYTIKLKREPVLFPDLHGSGTYQQRLGRVFGKSVRGGITLLAIPGYLDNVFDWFAARTSGDTPSRSVQWY